MRRHIPISPTRAAQAGGPGTESRGEVGVLGLGEDTALGAVAEDLGVHQLGRLVELLTHRECENLLAALSHPEDSVFHQLERLSPESNDLGLPPRVRRDTDRETQCRTALTGWLVNHGQQMYYDRLSRALQRIGRTDIAIEVGKNINQDKALSLQKYVEDYHRRVEAVGSSLVEPDMEPLQLASRQSTRQVRDLTWKDLELVVEREQRPPYSRRLADGVLPLVYGLVLGFTGALLVGALVLFCALHISQAHGSRLFRLCRKNRAKRRPSPAHFSCDLTSSESDSGMPLRPRRPSRDTRGFFRGFLQRIWGLGRQKPGLP
ncbi:transmembrane and death domain protein 1-like [Conger conger]|uniref:transmembrane and death domain protein 1-like n=1 Tax=Conger conger TaxID=82655 RepID=UPI002A5ACB76|nr:transmembrane and death domain protein 1-like [Conger conger]